MLSSALSAIPGLRGGRVSDEEYVALGRRSNSEEMSRGSSDELFDILREGESLDDVLEIPFSLARVKDVHAAMQLAVASVGDARDDLTGHSMFYPTFTAFVLGFAIGLVGAHRCKVSDIRGGVIRLSKRTVESCQDWGITVALFYLTKVEASGIVDRETDQMAYGIENRWRLIADERRLDAIEMLPKVVAAGRVAGESWFHDESVEMGYALSTQIEAVVSAYSDQVFS
jgi:hypothetical protein